MKTNDIKINGVKIGKHGVRVDGKYYPAWYSRGVLVNGVDTITIYAKNILKGLPAQLGGIQNNSDMMTDYFEKDRVRFESGTPEFNLLVSLAK